MQAHRIVATNVLLFAAVVVGAQIQSAPSNPPSTKQNMTQSTTQPGAIETKADKARAKEVKRQDKYNKKAAKNRVSAIKDQENAAKSRAKADKQRDQADVDRAKAATNQQKATPQP